MARTGSKRSLYPAEDDLPGRTTYDLTAREGLVDCMMTNGTNGSWTRWPVVALAAVLAAACGGGAPGSDPAPGARDDEAPAFPAPSFHHIHVNSADPERALDWWETFWPAGRRTTVTGLPAFEADGVYLLYTAVDEPALGGFDPEQRQSVPQSAFWTTGPSIWYVSHLGVTLPPLRDPDTGETAPRPPYDPCAVEIGDVSYPSFLPVGQLRTPIASVRLDNAGWMWYSRQCRDGRCGPELDRPLVPSRGQVVDHVAVTYPDLDPVLAHLEATGVSILEGPYPFGETRAVLIEDLDGLALELIEAGSD